jgi:hypothetical protein
MAADGFTPRRRVETHLAVPTKLDRIDGKKPRQFFALTPRRQAAAPAGSATLERGGTPTWTTGSSSASRRSSRLPRSIEPTKRFGDSSTSKR